MNALVNDAHDQYETALNLNPNSTEAQATLYNQACYHAYRLAGFLPAPPMGRWFHRHSLSLCFLSLFKCNFATTILEMTWSGLGIDKWWRNEQFWAIGGVSAHLFCIVPRNAESIN